MSLARQPAVAVEVVLKHSVPEATLRAALAECIAMAREEGVPDYVFEEPPDMLLIARDVRIVAIMCVNAHPSYDNASVAWEIAASCWRHGFFHNTFFPLFLERIIAYIIMLQPAVPRRMYITVRMLRSDRRYRRYLMSMGFSLNGFTEDGAPEMDGWVPHDPISELLMRLPISIGH